MTGAAVVEQLAASRAQLDTVCDLLRAPSPEIVEQCSRLLEAAGDQISASRPDLADAAGDPGALEEAWRLRRSFQRAAKLLDSAARFHENWLSIRGAMTGGYTNRGAPAAVQHTNRLCLEA